MSDPNVYWGAGSGGTNVEDVNVTAQFEVDNTGATDSGPTQQNALTTLAQGQGALYPKGTYLTATQVVLPPVGIQIRLGPDVLINQQLSKGAQAFPTTAWLYNTGTLRVGAAAGTVATTPTLYGDPQTVSVNLATKPLVGNFLNFASAGASKGGNSTYTVEVVAGGGPYTVTLDRPMVFPFVAGDTVQEYAAVPANIVVDGRYGTASGTADQLIEFARGNSVTISRFDYNTTLGTVSSIACVGAIVGLDVGMVSSVVEDQQGDMTGCQGPAFGYYMQSNERSTIRRCRVSNIAANGAGYYNFDSFSAGIENCWVYYGPSTTTGVAIGALSSSFNGCQDCWVHGGGVVAAGHGMKIQGGSVGTQVSDWSALACSVNGMEIIAGTSKTQVTNVSCTQNTNAGFIVQAQADFKNIDFSHNGGASNNAGFYADAGAGVTVSIDGGQCDLLAAEAFFGLLGNTGNVRAKNVRVTSAKVGGFGIGMGSAGRMELDGCTVNMTGGGGAASFLANAGLMVLRNCVAPGTTGVFGVEVGAGGTVIIDTGCDFSACAIPVGITAGGVVSVVQSGALLVTQAAGTQTFTWTQAASIVTTGTSGTIVLAVTIPNMIYLVDNTAASGAALMKASAGDAGISIANGKSAWVKVNAAGTTMIRVTTDT